MKRGVCDGEDTLERATVGMARQDRGAEARRDSAARTSLCDSRSPSRAFRHVDCRPPGSGKDHAGCGLPRGARHPLSVVSDRRGRRRSGDLLPLPFDGCRTGGHRHPGQAAALCARRAARTATLRPRISPPTVRRRSQRRARPRQLSGGARELSAARDRPYRVRGDSASHPYRHSQPRRPASRLCPPARQRRASRGCAGRISSSRSRRSRALPDCMAWRSPPTVRKPGTGAPPVGRLGCGC